MTAVVTAAPPNATQRPEPEVEGSGPIGRVVAASVAVGLVGALLLTLVVFAGAQEHVISGVALLAFALGWAMLGTLSTRLTKQPQRWAFFVATPMAMVGAYFLVFAPGDAVLRALGWVWPPLVFVLAVWMTVQARRHLHSRTRVVFLYPIFAFLVLCAIGGGFETVSARLDRGNYPMPGRAFDVAGHRLHLNCTGSGGPTVVLESGSGEFSPDWAWIAPAVASQARVCAYDRAGQGWSEDASSPQDGLQIAADLHTLLARAHETGPYVLVGHSTGGTYAMTYAARYPAEVAGLVLLDSSSPQQFTLPDYPRVYSAYRRVSALFPSLARLGVGHLAFGSVGGTLPARARDQVRHFATSPREMRTQRDEWSQLPAAFRQAQALKSLDGKPLVVITAAGEKPQTGWYAAQDRLATLSTNSVHRLPKATHESLLMEKGDSANPVQAILDVIASVRTGAPLPTA